MKKRLLLSGAIIGILFGSMFSYADTALECKYQPRPGMTGRAQDFGRTITGLITSIINLCGDGEAKAQLIATQEENNKNASGSGGSSGSTDTSSGSLSDDDTSESDSGAGSAGASEFSGSAYGYINTNLLSKGIGNITYEPLKTALTSAGESATLRQNLRSAVLENFFADPTKSEQSTTEYKNKIRKQRYAYIKEAAGRHVTLGYHVKGHIQSDLSVISSVAITGDGELGAIAVDSHTLEQMVKIALVDLALQIEMMEADAIHFLMQQPVELLSETKPTN